MITVSAIATKLPEFRYNNTELKEVIAEWLPEGSPEFEKYLRFSVSSKIQNRYFAIPAREIVQLESVEKRVPIFQRCGTALGTAVIERLLKDNQVLPQKISDLIFTSCTLPTIPAIDTDIIAAAGLPSTVYRVPLYQHGCAGGAVGLSLASRLRAQPGYTILLSVELCSLVYQAQDLRGGNLVGSALFADGAAAVLLSSSECALPGQISISACQSYLIPESTNLMGYDLMNNGAHLRLDRALPSALLACAPKIISDFLESHELEIAEIDYWLIHPGGVRILEGLEKALGLSKEQTCWSWEVLSQIGNVSSASLLFVFERFVKGAVAQKGDNIVLIGVGPGLTLELLLMAVS